MSENQTNLERDTEEIMGLISDEFDVTEEEVQSYLEEFYNYGIQGEQARNSALTKLANELDVSRNELVDQGGSSGGATMLSNLGDGQWGNVTAVVVDKWETKSDKVAQKGRLSDGEMTVQYVMWSNGTDDLPELEEGVTYDFESIVGNDNDGRFQIQINKASSITESDEEVEPASDEREFTGNIVDTQGTSGLIWRDPESGRVVDNNDGNVENDLRLILAVDDGQEVIRVHFGEELTEEITGISLDKAQEIAMDAMDREAVISQMLDDLLGRYITVTGTYRDGYLYTDEYEWDDDVPENVDEMLIKARSLN